MFKIWHVYMAMKTSRDLGHDVLTAREAGNAEQKVPDEEVLAFATSSVRAVLTFNRRHFIRLHLRLPDHAGIIVCTEDLNKQRLASRINEAISAVDSLTGQLIRVGSISYLQKERMAFFR